MFRKGAKVASQTLMKKSMVRQLRAKVLALFPSLTEDELERVLPLKGKVEKIKLSGVRTIVYSADDVPLFFDPSGNGNSLCPTVYMLWAAPNMLPAFVMPRHVLERLANGADFMLPGVVVPLEASCSVGLLPDCLGTWEKGDLIALRVYGLSSAPLVVGSALLSSDEVAKTGLRGKGIAVWHMYRDGLWELGPKDDPPVPCFEGLEGNEEPNDREEEAAAKENGTVSERGELEETWDPLEETRVDTDKHASSALKVRKGDAGKEYKGDTVATDGDAASPPPAVTLSTEEADELMTLMFLAAIKYHVTDAELPMEISQVYSKFMLQFRTREPVTVKNTSYKKVAKFMQAMARRGFVTIKPKMGQPHITSVNRSCEEYASASDFKFKPVASPGETAGEEAQHDTTLSIRSWYALPPSLSALVKTEDESKVEHIRTGKKMQTQLYAIGDIRKFFWAYVQQHGLESPDRKFVVLDLLLSKHFSTKNERVPDGLAMPKKEFVERLTKSLELYTHIQRGDHFAITIKGHPHPIVITSKRRGGNKDITLISGVELYGIDPEQFRQVIKKKFAASTTLNPLPGKGDRGLEVMIQGNMRKVLPGFLQERYGISNDNILVNNPPTKSKKGGRGGRK